MNYNELTYYHANPFYKQDFLPDRAWYNREPKSYPSEMPSGRDFFTDNGRKHFTKRFNHSEIQSDNILKSPERYPFQNRIAMDKTYMRSLQTIDIEGASSNTRINQSIKNKLKAKEQLTRRYNQSLEVEQNNEELKRRQVALKQYQSFKERTQNKISEDSSLQQSRLSKAENTYENSYSPTKAQLSNQYKRYVMQVSSNKFHKDKPVAQYPQHLRMQPHLKNNQTLEPKYSRESSAPSVQGNDKYRQNPQYEQISTQKLQRQGQKEEPKKVAGTPTSYYKNQFNSEKMRNSEQYQKILKYQQMNRRMLQNPKEFRKNNPTNLSLSFNLAGQNIVSN